MARKSYVGPVKQITLTDFNPTRTITFNMELDGVKRQVVVEANGYMYVRDYADLHNENLDSDNRYYNHRHELNIFDN